MFDKSIITCDRSDHTHASLEEARQCAAWEMLVEFADSLKADHFAGHPQRIGGANCDWCIAEQVADR